MLRFALLIASALCSSIIWAAPIVFQDFGTAADITDTRDAFRTAIGGGTVAGANQSFLGIRREINWDGVPAQFDAPNNLPANFFNSNSPRGVLLSTPGSGFQVSGNAGATPPEPAQFSNINANYPSLFEPFSVPRLFTALGSQITDVNFFIAGTSTPGATTAFGVIFSDVDVAGSSSLQFFDPQNNPLGSFLVPAVTGNETFSFLGVQFTSELIGRVRITSGNAALGAAVNESLPGTDLVVMDDFIFAEPRAVPEPASLALLGIGLAGLALRRRKTS